MAYEMKDGQWNLIRGNNEGKPALSFKIRVGGHDHEIIFWKKSFNWGTSYSGNIEGIKAIYCAFIRFTIIVIKYYMKEKLPTISTQDKPNTNNNLQTTTQQQSRQGNVL